jgi:hypothetical protein
VIGQVFGWLEDVVAGEDGDDELTMRISTTSVEMKRWRVYNLKNTQTSDSLERRHLEQNLVVAALPYFACRILSSSE